MRCTGYEIARYKGTQASHLYEKSMHTLCTIMSNAPGWSLNYPRPKSITHLRTFSDNGVYVALQLFLVILVSDQWRRVLIPYSYRQVPWGLLHARVWLFRYTWDQRLTWYPSHGRHTLQCWKPGFTPYNFGSSWDRTPNLLTTRPTCYHSVSNSLGNLIHSSFNFEFSCEKIGGPPYRPREKLSGPPFEACEKIGGPLRKNLRPPYPYLMNTP